MIRIVFALVLAAAAGSSARGADLYVSGRQAEVLCRDSEEWCVGFVTGALDGWSAMEHYYPGEKFCPAEGITTGQMKNLFVQELQARPEELETPAAYLLYERLIRDFPCL